MIVIPYTFQCKQLLCVLGRMLPPPELSEHGTVTEAAAQLANTLLRDVEVVDNKELLVTLDEPVEAVSIAREYELRIERAIISPLAVELLRDSGEPARLGWAWLQRQLRVDDSPRGVVRVRGQTRHLPEGIDQIPDRPGVLLWNVAQHTATLVERGTGLWHDAGLVELATANIPAAIVRFQNTWAVESRLNSSVLKTDGAPTFGRCLVPGMTIDLVKGRLVVLSVR